MFGRALGPFPSILGGSRRVAGIHFTGEGFHAVEVSGRRDRVRVTAFASGEFPGGVPDYLRLQEALRGAGFKSNSAYAVLPCFQGITRMLEVPPGTEEEVEQMVRLQVERELPFPPEEAFLSYVVSSPATGHTTGRLRLDMLQDELIVHVAIARKHVVESYREVLRLTGLNPLGIGFSPFASLRVAGLFRSEERVGDASVVSFEGDHVTILVIRPGGPLISRSIPYGNQDLEEGTVGWIEFFRREYERTVHWFHSVVSDLSIDEIHVSAPTDRLDVMREALNVIPSGKVMILSPASSCVLPTGVDPRQVSSHAAATGAGMAALRPRGTSDFSDGDRPKPLISLTRKQIRSTWVGLLVLLFLIVPKVYQERVEGERQSLANELADVKRDRKRLKPVVERVEQLYSLDADRLPLLWVMGDHSEIFDTRKIYLQSFSMNKGERLDLHGFAKNAEVVSDLVRQISELDPYQAVFKSGSELGGRSRRKNFPYKFHIQVILPQTGREAFGPVDTTPSREETP